MSTACKQQKGSDAQRSASKRKARGSHCQQGEGNRRRSKLTITNPDAAGIDIGAQVHYVAVPEDRAEVSVRSFGAYTAQLDELVQWLKDGGIKTVAMESTGVYWIPLYQKLEEAGFEVLLVDARQAKHVPGRKSDVQAGVSAQTSSPMFHCVTSPPRAATRPATSSPRTAEAPGGGG